MNKDVLTFAKTITAADLEAHLRFLASDALEGRETGENGQKVAAEYLAAQFAKMGLKPGNHGEWFQNYELNQTKVEDMNLSFDGKESLKLGKDFVFFSNAYLAESFTAPLAFAGYGIKDGEYDNLSGLDLKGKAVLVLAGEPEKDGKSVLTGTMDQSSWSSNPKKKLEALAETGAKIFITVVPDEEYKRFSGNPWLRHRMTGKSLRLAYLDKHKIGKIFISESTANRLIKKSKKTMADFRKSLAENPKVPAIDFKKNKFTLTTKGKAQTIIAENVLGFLEGTDKKDEVVVLTAHYDHLGVKEGKVYNGADDDGSGVAAVIEIAEAFAKAAEAGARPRRSILFMPVSGEEKGLLGSRYYSDHPVYALENTVCNLNIDMIG
ncbi:MAG: M28 family peptidase, partial [Bacteroidota bacterium]